MNITAKIKNVVVENQDNGFCLLVLDYNGKAIRAHGHLPSPRKGETIQAAGHFARHDLFGWSLQAVLARDEVDARLAARRCSMRSRAVKSFHPANLTDWRDVSAALGWSKAQTAVEAARILVQPFGLPLDRLVERVCSATGIESVEARPAITAEFVITPKGNVVTKAMIETLKNAAIPANEPRTVVDGAQFQKIVGSWSSPTLVDSEKAAVLAAINATSIVIHHPSALRANVLRSAIVKLAGELKATMPFVVVTDLDCTTTTASEYLGLAESGWMAIHRCEWTPTNALEKCVAGAANGVPVFSKKISDGVETVYDPSDEAIFVESKTDDDVVAEIRTLIQNDDTIIVSPAPVGPYSPDVLNRRIHERDDGVPIDGEIYHGDIVLTEDGKFLRATEPMPGATIANVVTLDLARMNPAQWGTVVVVLPELKVPKTWVYSAMKLARKRIVVLGSSRAVSSIIKTSVVPRALAAEMMTKG